MVECGSKPVKVIFAASSGGHLEQLLALRPLMDRYDSLIVTESTGYEVVLPARVERVSQVNRHEALFPLKMLANAASALRIVLRERPDAVVCTGALATVPLCLIARAMGARLVFIESFAKTSSATQTGKLLRGRADRFYVQWPSMLDVYPDARCVGGVY